MHDFQVCVRPLVRTQQSTACSIPQSKHLHSLSALSIQNMEHRIQLSIPHAEEQCLGLYQAPGPELPNVLLHVSILSIYTFLLIVFTTFSVMEVSSYLVLMILNCQRVTAGMMLYKTLFYG
jgi:hypothetical protein